MDPHVDDSKDDTIRKTISDTIYTSRIHVNGGKLNYSSLIEIKELPIENVHKLTNTLYNVKSRKKPPFPTPGYSCYSPRNGLIFFDKNGKVFDYLEICFECQQYESQSGKITIGTFCNQKYDLLKSFFIDLGIKYGALEK